MTATLVLDCSMALSWCFADEASPGSAAIQDRLINEAAIVPAHWFLEVANLLAMAERRSRIRPEDSTEFLSLLRTLEIHVDGEAPHRAFDHLLPLCRNHGLTAYDAAYLDLAMRRRLPLATLDDALRGAAVNLGVAVIGA